jgi:hypothetical protein
MIHDPPTTNYQPPTISPKLDLLYPVIRSTLVKLSVYIEKETLVNEISLGGCDQSIE